MTDRASASRGRKPKATPRVTPHPGETAHLSKSVSETESIASTLASSLKGGDCLALHGDLGAGKTQFVRGLVRGLGGNPRAVSSPTFVLLNRYDSARLTLYHLDAYRVHGPGDFEAIGFPELLEDPSAAVVVEWPERIAELLPAKTIHVTLSPLSKNRRRITIAMPRDTA